MRSQAVGYLILGIDCMSMKTYDIHDKEGRVLSFEVPNALLSRRQACAVIQDIPGVVVLRHARRLFSREPDNDEFCEFSVGDEIFVMWEPWGDNSRYWIGTRPPHPCPELEQVCAAFHGYQPMLHTWGLLRLFFYALGGIVLLRALWQLWLKVCQ
jgi:hypothetical protein